MNTNLNLFLTHFNTVFAELLKHWEIHNSEKDICTNGYSSLSAFALTESPTLCFLWFHFNFSDVFAAHPALAKFMLALERLVKIFSSLKGFNLLPPARGSQLQLLWSVPSQLWTNRSPPTLAFPGCRSKIVKHFLELMTNTGALSRALLTCPARWSLLAEWKCDWFAVISA